LVNDKNEIVTASKMYALVAQPHTCSKLRPQR